MEGLYLNLIVQDLEKNTTDPLQLTIFQLYWEELARSKPDLKRKLDREKCWSETRVALR